MALALPEEEISERSDDVGVKHDLEAPRLPVPDLLSVPHIVQLIHRFPGQRDQEPLDRQKAQNIGEVRDDDEGYEEPALAPGE